MNIIVCQNDLPDNAKILNYASIDTEATGLSFTRDRLCLIQIKSEDNIVYLVQVQKNPLPAPNLFKLLQDQKIAKLFHYARFDVGILFNTYNVMCNNIYCTKIASKLTRTYSDRHGLKEICRQMLGIELNKGQQASDWGAVKLSDAQQNYAAMDVVHLWDLKIAFDTLLEREGRMELFRACCDFLPTRVKLDIAGWPEADIFAHH